MLNNEKEEKMRADVLSHAISAEVNTMINTKTPDGDSTFPMTPDRYSKH